MVRSESGVAVSEQLSVNPPKRLLFGPGPSQVHPRVYQAMAQPVVGHLDPYFFEISLTTSACCARYSASERR